MKHEPAWRRYLRFWGPDSKGDIDDEFRFHLQSKTDELIASGMKPGEAQQEAVRQFGPQRTIRRECYAIDNGRLEKASRADYLAGWLRDLGYAVRMLYKTRASSATAILILALGIGANTAVFTLLDRLLFRPLPVPKPSELLLISNSSLSGVTGGERALGQRFSHEAYLYLRDHTQALSGLAAMAGVVARERRLREKIIRPAVASPVSGNFFAVLQVTPLLGRALAPSDDVQSGASRIAVASHRFWTRRFNQAPDAVGRSINLNDVPFTIVGVMPRGFYGLSKGFDPDLYIPLGSIDNLFDFKPLTQGRYMDLLGRMKPDHSAASAQSNLQTLWEPFLQELSRTDARVRQRLAGARIDVEDGSTGYAGTSGEKRSSLLLLAAIVVLLLLIGCANVACLLIARGAARRQEIAIRMSLGAGKARILRQMLLESSLLAGIGGLAGLVVAFWAGRLLLIAFQWQERPIDLLPDWRILAFCFGVSLATGVLFGLAPALQALCRSSIALSQERKVAPFSSGKALVIVEVALSLVMIAGAAVFIRSFQNLRSTPLGFTAQHISIVRLTHSAGNDPGPLNPPAREAMRLTESLRGAPGIESATVADFVTFNEGWVTYKVTGLDASAEPTLAARVLRVDRNYFSALRIPLIAGRGFTSRDSDNSPAVVVLGEGSAQRLFPNVNPVGRSIRVGPGVAEVVGIAKDIKFSNLREPPPDLVYRPLLQGTNHAGMVKLQVRSRMSPVNVAAVVQDRIRHENLPMSVDSAAALEDEIGATLQNDRIRMQASSLFGTLALLLIAAGIYGLMTYSAVRRTREIGIRMAIGSSPAQIVRLMLNESVTLVLIGVVLGIPGALAVMKAVSGLVFGLPRVDTVSLVIAGVILLATGVAAGVGPAWRAGRLDPVNALRLE